MVRYGAGLGWGSLSEHHFLLCSHSCCCPRQTLLHTRRRKIKAKRKWKWKCGCSCQKRQHSGNSVGKMQTFNKRVAPASQRWAVGGGCWKGFPLPRSASTRRDLASSAWPTNCNFISACWHFICAMFSLHSSINIKLYIPYICIYIYGI